MTSLKPSQPSVRCLVVRAIVFSITACLCGCDSEQSVNAEQGGDRLSHASNNIGDQGSWAFDGTNMDERWDEDPTVMEPDYPFAGAQPGFGSQAFTSDD
ncbi:MAG: hypothetical protein EXS15_08370 [Phycisphaerales bacterium]|nr:hypothetical protein [Phycisphaerales bacterium]